MSLAFQISENSVIGLILILRGEMTDTIYHQAIYHELLKITSKNINSQISEVKFVMELLSITNFEDIIFFLCQNQKEHKVLIERLLKITFSSRVMFRIFNGYVIIDKIIDKSLMTNNDIEKSVLKNYLAMARLQIFGNEFHQKYYSPEMKQQIDEIWNQENKQLKRPIDIQLPNSAEEQIINYYKSEKITFYTFLKKSQRDEPINKSEKNEFLFSISTSFQIKLEYLYMLLEQQQGVLANTTSNQPLLNGLKANALQNLLILINFKDAVSVGKTLKYFINYNPKAYESIDLNKVQIELQKFIDVEQTIASFQLPNTIPYQLQKLLNLFINQIFYTRIPIKSSIYSDIFNYLKYEMDNNPFSEQLQPLKNLIPFSEKFIKMMFSSNSNERNLAIKQVLQLLHPQPAEQEQSQKIYNFQIDQIQKFISGMMDKNYEIVLQYLIKFCDQINEKKYRKFFKKAIAIIRGFVTTDSVKEDDNSTKQLIWATQQLKYFIRSDLDSFMEFLAIYFNTVLSTEKPNNDVILGLFSLMTSKPNYELLGKNFDLDEELLKLAYFLVSAIFSGSKSKILSDPEVHKLIEKNFGIKDFNPLIELSEILESNSMDSNIIIIKLKLEQKPFASKLFKVLFAFKRQLVSGDSWKQLQDNFNILAEQRAEIFKQDKDYKKQQGAQGTDFSLSELLELLHWFANPRPTNFLYLLNKINILEQQEPAAIFMAAVGAIGKYDIYDSYLEKQPEKIRNRADNLQKFSLKSINEALLLIAQTSDQDLQEAFSLLQLVTGINPVLISAIFNPNLKNNAFLQQILSTEPINYQQKIKEFLNRFDTFENLGISAVNRIKIIEFETLKNAQSDEIQKEQKLYFDGLNISYSDYEIVEQFLISTSRGRMSQNFPLSQIVMIYALKHLRETRKSKDQPFAQYVKGQYCINIAFTVFEKYLYFYDNKNLANLNKPALVKLLTLGLFDTTRMRQSDSLIDYEKLEGLLYPGLSDPFLECQGSQPKFNQFKTDNLSELAKNLIDNYEEYCVVFYRLLPVNENGQVQNNQAYEDYDKLWSQFFSGEALIQNSAVIYQSSKQQGQNDQKQYYEKLGKAAQGPKIQMQYQLISKFSQLNISQYSYIRSKYWDKSMELIKKQIFSPSEIDVLEGDQSSQQTQQIMIALLQYYAGQFNVQYNKDNTQKQQQTQKQKQISVECFQPLLREGKELRVQPKFRGSKSKDPINLSILIDNFLRFTFNEAERKQLKPLVDLFYNPKSMDTEFISNLFGNDNVIMDAILQMLVRIQLEQAKSVGKFSEFANKVPGRYLYYSLGDQYENLQKEDLVSYKKNSDQMNLGIEELIQDCNEIQPSIKAPLKLMIRCYLGDIEAWYTLIAFSRKQETVDTEYLSERLIRTFLIELLIEFKNTGLRSLNVEKQKLASMSFLQLLQQQCNNSLIKIIETSLINTFAKDNEYFPTETVSKLMQFLGFVFEGRTDILADENNSGFIFIMKVALKIENNNQQQQKLIDVTQFLLQLLFKGEKSNSNFSIFEEKLEFDKKSEDEIAAWKFTKALIEIDHSKDVNVLISKAQEILNQYNLQNYIQYVNLLISICSIKHVGLYPTSQINEMKIISVIFYPILWLCSRSEETREPISEFQQQSQQFIQNANNDDFKELLDQFYILSNYENNSQSAITQQNIEFYKKAILNWCKEYQQVAISEFFYFIYKDVFNISSLPSGIKVLIEILINLMFNVKLNQDPEQKLLKQFIDELTKIEPLDKQKDVIKAIIIMFSGLSDSRDIKGQKFQDAINTLLSKHNSEVGEIVKFIFAFYQTETENVDSLKELLLKIYKGCFNSDLQKSKFDNLPLSQLIQITSSAQTLIKKLEHSKGIEELKLLALLKPVLEPMFTQKQEKELKILIKCIEAIIAIKNQKFNELTSELFQIMKISQSNSQLLINLMRDFQVGLNSPQQLIKEKMAYFINPNTVTTMQYMNSVITKLIDNRELQYEDMFRVLDKHGQRSVKASDVIEFLRRINIEITEHKFREIIVIVKEDQVNLQTCMIDFYEFKQIMQEISVQTMFLSLEYLGISKPLLIRGLVVLIIYLAIVLAFILIGVQAFAIPGTFAAIVNAVLPMIGGFGLNKQAAEEKLKALNLTAILDVVKKAIKVIQSRRM